MLVTNLQCIRSVHDGHKVNEGRGEPHIKRKPHIMSGALLIAQNLVAWALPLSIPCSNHQEMPDGMIPTECLEYLRFSLAEVYELNLSRICVS